jgi:hypothetical protein
LRTIFGALLATVRVKMRTMKKIILVAAMLLGVATVNSVSAQTTWQYHHPRRAEVNHRLANQNARIHHERSEGELTARQAHRLHRDDRAIRGEERAMARAHHGHISRGEQRMLNRQENGVSRRIGR